MTQRRRSYFFSSITGALGKLFKTGNKPDEKAFYDFMESVTFKQEPADSMTTGMAGHAKLGSDDHVINRSDSANGYTVIPSSSRLPNVSLTETSGTDDAGVDYGEAEYNPTTYKENGLELVLVRKGSTNKYRSYVVKHLADTNSFEYDGTTKVLKIKASGVSNAQLAGSIEITKIINLGKGVFMVGGASANGTVTMNTDTQFLICDTAVASGVKAVVMSADATMDKDGKITIANKAVTLAKMNDLARGSIIIGDASNRPVELSVISEGYIMIGQGATAEMKPLTGVISLTKGGLTAFVDGTVKTRHLHADLPGVGLGYSGSDDAKKLDVLLGTGLTVDDDGKIIPTYSAPLEYNYAGETTDATLTELFVDDISERLGITLGYVFFYHIVCIATQTAGTAGAVGASYSRVSTGAIKNVGGTTAIVTRATVIHEEADTGFLGTMEESADNTNDALKIAVQGEVNKTITWNVKVQIIKLQFA